jgi:tetratricopeptide (TPR) repeat protein
MDQPDELDQATHEQVVSLASEGDSLLEAGELSAALNTYLQALELLPEPVHQWEAATWLLTALGDVLFLQGNYLEAQNSLHEALHCPGAVGNPFIHLRLGQINYELQEPVRAKDEFVRAYMGGGDEVFEGEDPKYKQCIKEILPPEGF